MTNYLFSTHPGSFKQFGFVVLFGFLLLVVFGFSLQVYLKKLKGYHFAKKLIKKMVPWAYLSGALGLFLWFVRYEGAPYISIRFLLWLLIVASLVYLAVVVILDIRQWGERRKKRDEELRRKKYLK